jgi:carbonic anhydrase
MQPTHQPTPDAHIDHALTVLPARGRFAILTCMDASIDASKLRGLPGSEAHVIRNAGARANDDAIRSLLLAHRLLGARAMFLVHHHACGMALLSDEITGKLWASAAHASGDAGHRRETATDRRGLFASEPIGRVTVMSPAELVRADVERIRRHPDVSAELPVRGFMFHAESGYFQEVS